MASHVSQGMQKQMYVGMANHVSTCMSMEKSIKGEGNQFVEEERNKKERKEKKREEKRREKKKKGREKEREKEIGVPTVETRRTKK